MRERSRTIDYWTKDSSPDAEPLLLNERRAAKMLGICGRTLFDLQKRGEITARRLGGRKLYHIDDIRNYANGLPIITSENPNNGKAKH